MIYLDWQDVSETETARLMAEINPAAPYKLPEGKTRLRVAALPFYDEYNFYGMADTTIDGPNERYMLYKPGDIALLNWTNEPIYKVNEQAPIKLERKTVIPYAKFFFHYVRGQLGRFIIVEKPEEVTWHKIAKPDERAKVDELLMPVTYKGITKDNLYTLTATVVFKNALFRTDIKIAPMDMEVYDDETGENEQLTIGQLKLTNEELLLEDLNMPIDPPPSEFG